MNDFRFYNPVRIHFGQSSLNKLPKELAVRRSCWPMAAAVLSVPACITV